MQEPIERTTVKTFLVALAPTIALVALLTAISGTSLSFSGLGAFILLAVVFAGFYGGLGAGLASAAIGVAYLASDPGAPFQYSVANANRAIAILIATPAMALLVGGLRDRLLKTSRGRDRQRSAVAALAAVADSSDDGIIGKATDGTITSWNRGAERMFGYTADEIVGQNSALLFPADRGEEADSILTKARQGETVSHMETVRRRRDGTLFDVSVTVAPIRDADGLVIAAAATYRDISDLKRVQEELARRAAELTRSNRDLEQFAYVASHDLQEPLRMVTSYVQLLERRYKGKLEAEADEFIHFAVDGATRMQRLINELLEYSRVGTRGKAFESVDCERILATVLANLNPAIVQAHATVKHAPLPEVWADPVQLAQVFQNLIANGIKFHRDAAPEVYVSAQRSGVGWTFSVRDNGIGIDPRHRERLFVIFQRLHDREAYPGTGIGLAVCKKIVERHGGRIWLESEGDGKGTTIHFTLPARDHEHVRRAEALVRAVPIPQTREQKIAEDLIAKRLEELV